MAQAVKNPPAMQEARVQSLGQEDTLEKGKATHSSILAWRIPRSEEPGGLQSMGLQSWRQLTNIFISLLQKQDVQFSKELLQKVKTLY